MRTSQNIHLKKINILNTLDIISTLFSDLDEKWAITGGCALFINNGIRVPSDVDIITTFSGATKIKQLLKSNIIKDSGYSTAAKIKSFYFKAIIDRVFVEVMGDPINKINGTWVPNQLWYTSIQKISFQKHFLYVTTLEYEYIINSILKNHKRTSDIKIFLS